MRIPLLFILAVAVVATVAITAVRAADQTMPSVGQVAPTFTLPSQDGSQISLDSFRGKWVVLYFYPKDMTPGCTKQLCAIRDDYSQFQEKNAKVFGVNPGDKSSHRKFIEKHKFQFPLLIDEKRAVAKQYGCDSWPMLKRTVYVIDTKGKIIYAKRGMPDNAEILKAIPQN